MTSDTEDREFLSSPQISFQMEVTSEQLAMLKAWSEMVPTLHFLDICMVSATKLSDSAIKEDPRKGARIERLRDRDHPQHAFSYLLALIEKASDLTSSLSDTELEEQILKDVASLRSFFRNGRVIESDEFLIGYLRNLRRVPAELLQPAYLEFLVAANNKFTLRDSVAPRLRLKTAQNIIHEADRLSIPRQHPVVLVVLACLYGNDSAKKVMKFKANPNKFAAQNALSDIMVMSRFLPLKLEIEDSARRGTAPYLRTAFITGDSGLQDILQCFEPKSVRQSNKGDRHETKTNVTVKLADLLTHVERRPSDVTLSVEHAAYQEPVEYDHICDMLFQPLDVPI